MYIFWRSKWNAYKRSHTFDSWDSLQFVPLVCVSCSYFPLLLFLLALAELSCLDVIHVWCSLHTVDVCYVFNDYWSEFTHAWCSVFGYQSSNVFLLKLCWKFIHDRCFQCNRIFSLLYYHIIFFFIFLSFLYIVNIICLFDMEFVKILFLFYMLSLCPNDDVLHHALAVEFYGFHFIILILMLELMGFCSEFFFCASRL